MTLQAAQAMSAYTGWAPQEFNEAALGALNTEPNSTIDGDGSPQAEAGTSGTADSEFQYDTASGVVEFLPSAKPDSILFGWRG